MTYHAAVVAGADPRAIDGIASTRNSAYFDDNCRSADRSGRFTGTPFASQLPSLQSSPRIASLDCAMTWNSAFCSIEPCTASAPGPRANTATSSPECVSDDKRHHRFLLVVGRFGIDVGEMRAAVFGARVRGRFVRIVFGAFGLAIRRAGIARTVRIAQRRVRKTGRVDARDFCSARLRRSSRAPCRGSDCRAADSRRTSACGCGRR